MNTLHSFPYHHHHVHCAMKLEVYGAQPPIELLRQYMDFGGWYGRDNDFRTLVDCQFISAMGPPGGGRNLVTNRYLRHFNQIGVAQVIIKQFFIISNKIVDQTSSLLFIGGVYTQQQPILNC